MSSFTQSIRIFFDLPRLLYPHPYLDSHYIEFFPSHDIPRKHNITSQIFTFELPLTYSSLFLIPPHALFFSSVSFVAQHSYVNIRVSQVVFVTWRFLMKFSWHNGSLQKFVFLSGEEFHIGCSELCECTGADTRECAALECPNHVGLELMSKGCVRWAPSPPARPPNCCPRSARCLSDGTCHYNGVPWVIFHLKQTDIQECIFYHFKRLI